MIKKILFVLLGFLAFANLAVAQSTLRGRVTEADGDGIPNASVKVKGTNRGTLTNNNGEFSINAGAGDELEISAVGYTKATVKAEAGMVVKMAKDKKSVGEVVVTAFNQKRQSREIGYSSVNIGNGELNQAKVVNPLNGITGKVAGASIQTTNNGVRPTVRILLRGNRHITGTNQAMIVVDGIIVDNDFFTKLNPNDIESTNILLGAAASAIYGSEASNGVLIVTTRKGAGGKGKSRISLTSTVTAERLAYLPKFQNRFGSYGGEAFNALLGIQFPNDPTKIYFPYENQSYGPEYNGEAVPLGGPVSVNFADGQSADLTRYIDYSAVNNSKYRFFQTALSFQNGISIASGDESSNYLMSYQNVKSNGIVPGDNAKRNIFRINGSKSFGKFRLDFNTSYTNEKLDEVGGSYIQNRPIYWTLINGPSHVDYDAFRDWKTNPFATPSGYYNAYYGNPWWQIDEARNKEDNNFILGNIRASLDLTSWLTASYNVGIARNDYNRSATQNGHTFDAWAIADPWQAGMAPSSIKYLAPSVGDQRDTRNRINGDLLLTARKNFGDFTTKLMLGQTAWSRTRQVNNSSTAALVFPGLYNIAYRQGEPVVSNFSNTIAQVSVFADASVGYKNFAFLHGSVRNETDSRLAKENRNYTYPAVDGSIVLTDAIKALNDNKYLNYAKLRGGLAKVGQVNISPYSLINTVAPGNGFPYGTNAGFSLSNIFKNPSIKPEFTTERELGLELAFLNNRINLNTTVYNARTTNQTIDGEISAASGATTSIVNLGSMTNKGIELQLRLTPFLKLGPVKWNVGANYTYNKNVVGQDLGSEITLVNPNNLSTTSGLVFATPGQSYPYVKESDWVRSPDGKIVVDANTGLPSRASGLVGFGTSTAPRMIGLNTSFNYKAFTLSAVADGRFGAVINNLIGEDLDFTGISWYSAQTGRQPFVIPNSVIKNADGNYVDNTNTVVNDANWSFWANTWNRTHSHYVNSADFWKLREVALSYNLPAALVKRTKIMQGASLSVFGRNLAMWRPSDNVWTDPEFSDADAENATGTTTVRQTPPTRLWGASLNINF
jgi:TonB-linked SusC/RagA family outer membrane protein